jgi:outer membrane protein OmpA-like peptidoglycan-associated protein
MINSIQKQISLSCLLLALLAPLALRADQTNIGAFQEAAPWLQLPTSARNAGMGNAFGAMGEDLNTLDANPAGLVQMERPQLLLTHDEWFQGVAVEHGSIGLPLDSWSAFALSFDYLNLGSVDAYTVSGDTPVANGTFNPNGFNLEAGYALAMSPHLDFGLGLKYIQQNISSSSGGQLGADFGLMVHGYINHLTLGASVENMGANLQSATLPMDLKVALAYKAGSFDNAHIFNVDVDAIFALAQSQAVQINAGAEYWIADTVALRAGDQISDEKVGTGWDGLTFGAGVLLGDFEVDYAFMNNGDLGNSNLVSLLIELDKKPEPVLAAREAAIVEHVNKNIQFSFNTAYIRSEFNAELDELGDILLQRPQDHVVLYGYASHEGTESHNQELSQWRANEVRSRILARGVPSERVIALGKGETNQIVNGSTEADLSPNRRVEIRVIQPRPGRE